ncbi:EAL domain-containing protein [Asticcacaulis sp. YBE204]|uniref:EAL domain-containing protein n=1 Tax=Asticcacaulis sp. YBE204 TaxID=1282363 RepID=UPI0009DFE38F
MDLSCFVEGVETADQLAVLRKLGCNLIHGYYFAQPLDAKDVTDACLQPHIASPCNKSLNIKKQVDFTRAKYWDRYQWVAMRLPLGSGLID